MASPAPAQVVNRLIAGLPRQARERLLRGCERVELVPGSNLCEPTRPYRHVYFPLTSFISVVETVGLHPPLQTGLIGNEGMLGATLALGMGSALLRGVVHGPGSALRMSAAQLQRELLSTPSLLQTLNRYNYVRMGQLSQIAACNRFHEVEARLARWLLMTHDRAHADHFYLTHKNLADMLGVQRSAVTIAAGALQRRKLIRYTRGEISILSREGLEAAACECYGVVIRGYAQVFG